MIQYCRTCILPNTRPGLVFDQTGQCNACQNSEKRPQVDWNLRRGQFEKLVSDTKKRAGENNWDCVIPVSGGKDSTWQTLVALEHGLHPLCVTWRTPARTPVGQKNLNNLIGLGVDHIDFSINPNLEREFTKRTFTEKGSPAIPMHMALFALPLQTARKFQIPLVLWGENSAIEYGSLDEALLGSEMSRKWLLTHGVTQGTVAEDWIGPGLSKKQMTPYYWPTDAELQSSGVRAGFLGHYFRWDPVDTYAVAKKHGFQALKGKPLTGLYDFADVDDGFIITIHHWMKWLKFGFTRIWDNLSLEIRNGRLNRDQAMKIVIESGEERPQEAIDGFCNWLGWSVTEFFEKADRFRDTKIWKKNEFGIWQIPGFLIEGWDWK